MKKAVNNSVSKRWAAEAKRILTRNTPDTTTLFTRLTTLTLEEQQSMKASAARARLDKALEAVFESIKYGWAFGLNETQVRIKRPMRYPGHRRVRALLPFAIEAGHAIGQAQAKKVNRAHGIPKPRTADLENDTHDSPAGAALLSLPPS